MGLVTGGDAIGELRVRHDLFNHVPGSALTPRRDRADRLAAPPPWQPASGRRATLTAFHDADRGLPRRASSLDDVPRRHHCSACHEHAR